MNIGRYRTEHILYLLIFVAALFVRLLLLGSNPLTDTEAGFALQAAAGESGGAAGVINPAYQVITKLLFDVFGQSNFMARLWPALAGSLLVLTPYFFRRWLGMRAALLLAAGLAIDPGLAAISRTAGGLLPAITALVLAAGAWLNGYPIAAGIFAGLALLSGPSLWPGLIAILLVVFLLGNRLQQVDQQAIPMERIDGGDGRAPDAHTGWNYGRNWFKFGAAAAITFVVVGMGLLREPGGAGAAFNSLPVYLRSWIGSGGMALVPFLATMPFYEILPLTFGIMGGVRSIFRWSTVDHFLGLWLIMAAILAIINPTRQPADWAWSLVPLWALAARHLERFLRLPEEEKLPSIVQFGVAILVLVFVTFSFSNMLDTFQANPLDEFSRSRQNLQWIVLLGALLLLILTSYLISWGWAAPISLRGLVWAAALVMLSFTISGASRSTGINLRQYPELWQGNRQPEQVTLLLSTMDDLSRWNTGLPGQLKTEVIQLESPALRWALRNSSQASFLPAASRDDSPALMITNPEGKPGLPAAYRGQDFVLSMDTPWQDFALVDWMKWAVFRRAPQTPTTVILWARSDLFADGKTSAVPAAEAPALTP